MAKTKKKQLTIEEKLELALVPKEEQPYEIPDNWVWVRLEDILEKLTDGSHFSPKIISEGKPYITVRDITEGIIDFNNCKKISDVDYIELRNNGCQPILGDVLFSKDGTVGKTALINYNKDFVVLSSLAILRPYRDLIDSEFLELLLKSPFLYDQAINSKTGTAIRRIVLKHLKLLKVPIPPYNEQLRVLKKGNKLIHDLNEAKQLIQEAKESFELRRASILNKAFTGELTAKWRETNSPEPAIKLLEKINDEKLKKWEEECLKAINEGKRKPKKPEIKPVEEMIIPKDEHPYEIPDSWEWVRLESISEIISGYSFKSGDFQADNSVRSIKITNVGVDKFVHSEDQKLPKEFIETYSNYIVKANDLLLALTRPYIKDGLKISICPEEYDNSLLNQRVAVIKGHYVKYIYGYFKSNHALDYVKINCSSTNQPNLSIKKVFCLPFPLPPVEERIHITNIFCDLLNSENKTKELLEMESQIELIEKSILNKAFRGELGTNDVTDEPAIELLKRILAEGD